EREWRACRSPRVPKSSSQQGSRPTPATRSEQAEGLGRAVIGERGTRCILGRPAGPRGQRVLRPVRDCQRRAREQNQTNQAPRRSRSVARVIFHVDMDAFYVSGERRENPELVGQPVIVGEDPKKGQGRGGVMAASYEARQLGIRSGMPSSTAWHKAPQAVFLRPDYNRYAAASESVIEVLRSYADVLEHVSIDEAFLDVTSKVKGFDEAAGYAARVKAAVREREGLACTVGAAPNK